MDACDADLICEVNGSRRLDDSQLAISVCLSTYNFERTVVRALDTILHQTYSNYEVVVSDDASSDRTVDTARSYLESYTGPVRVRLYRARENGGIVRNRLRGMSYAGGGYLSRRTGTIFPCRIGLRQLPARGGSSGTAVRFS